MFKYRSEIDGLRAIAILPVILFHAGFSYFPGGFIGVDIFFVISGYLITSIIINDLDNNNFSFLRFYERRARRILPAFFVVMMVCIFLGWITMTPLEYSKFFESFLSATFSVSNIYFWRSTNYFSILADFLPLLHTWSLAVEEQYYLLFPGFLVLFWRFGRTKVFIMILVISLLSLLISEWGYHHYRVANYFLLPTRAWELLAGSICAFVMAYKSPKQNEILSIIGFALILFSIFFYSNATPFPSVYALVPVGGAVLIILFCRKTDLLGKFLSTKVMVGIGLISYSAYLWHQPLFAFTRVRFAEELTFTAAVSLSIFSLMLGAFTWKFVEQPFRVRKSRFYFDQKTVFKYSTVGIVILTGCGFLGVASDGLKFRFPDSSQSLLAAASDVNPNRKHCHYSLHAGDATKTPKLPVPECTTLFDDDKIKVVILGDSHADAAAYSIRKKLSQEHISNTEITFSACSPFPGYSKENYDCAIGNEVVANFLKTQDIEVYILIARYSAIFNDKPFDNLEGGVEPRTSNTKLYFSDSPNQLLSQSEAKDQVSKMIKDHVEQLTQQNKKVVLVYPIPEAGWHVPELARKTLLSSKPIDFPITTSYQLYLDRNKDAIQTLDSIQGPNIFRVKPQDIFCDNLVKGRCINATKEVAYYYDDDHLSNAGAAPLADAILTEVKKALQSPNTSNVSTAE